MRNLLRAWDRSSWPRNASLVSLVIGAAVVLAAEIYAGGSKALFSLFTCLTLLPLILLYPAIRIMTRYDAKLILFAVIAIVVAGSFFYVDAIFVHSDPQSGLIFLVVPSWQLVAVLILYLIVSISLIVRQRHATRDSK